MGIDVSTYLFVGAKVPENKRAKAREYMEENDMEENVADVIYDWMCGDYAYVGHIVNSIGQHDCHEDIVFSEETLAKAKTTAKQLLEKGNLFKKLNIKEEDIKLRIINDIG